MRHLIGAASLTALMTFGGVASAQVPNNKVKIGVLSDFSGPFSDQAGKGSFIAAQMAAEDFARESKGLKGRDHLRRPPEQAGRRRVDRAALD